MLGFLMIMYIVSLEKEENVSFLIYNFKVFFLCIHSMRF